LTAHLLLSLIVVRRDRKAVKFMCDRAAVNRLERTLPPC